MKQLKEIFRKFDARIDELNQLKEISVHSTIAKNYSISHIERYLITLPFNEGIERIESALLEVSALRDNLKRRISHIKVIDLHEEYGKVFVIEEGEKKFKKELQKHLKTELDHYHTGFTKLKEKLKLKLNLSTVNNTKKILPTDLIVIDEKYPYTRLKNIIGTVRLDVFQTALLFYYLKEQKVIYNHHNKNLAPLICAMTGHSEQGMRTKEGLGNIPQIKSDELKTDPNCTENFHNFKSVKTVLQAIIDAINEEIKVAK